MEAQTSGGHNRATNPGPETDAVKVGLESMISALTG